LIPELELIWMPPPAPGSGKFGTPCERMQLENLRPDLENADGEPPADVPDDPHALSATAAVSVLARRAGNRMVGIVVVGDRR
jgi:hypothetical protein